MSWGPGERKQKRAGFLGDPDSLDKETEKVKGKRGRGGGEEDEKSSKREFRTQ